MQSRRPSLNTQKRRTRTTILDPRRLARELQKRIDEDFGGNTSAAAVASGISQPTLHRLTKGTATANNAARRYAYRTLGRDVSTKVSAFLGTDARRSLFWSSGSVYGLFLYSEWMAALLKRIGETGLTHEHFAWNDSLEGPWRGRDGEFWSLVTRIHSAAPAVASEISKTASRLSKVDDDCRRVSSTIDRNFAPKAKARDQRPITPARFMLALYRMLEPLLDAAATGWIELRAEEMTDAHFRRFVEASWKREELLLRRDGDIKRIQRLDLLPALNDPRKTR